MGHAIFEFLRHFIAEYGYWAVALALLCENAGLPVPGETTLLLASFLAYSEHKLDLIWIVVIATCAASFGDNIGFALGHFGGRPLLKRYRQTFRISQEALERGEKLFGRYGASTVFLARFIFGLRIFAGPLAGVLRMPWKEFAVFNFLGAAVWVTVISLVGYFFGQHWDAMEHVLGRFNLVGGILVFFLIVFLWRKYHRPAVK
ncbi:MAG TPA: DedA family protein [Terriglobales bacterium]|jgi:membrane protein DedA with SNARE-associated domain|nr:DedA family protein [Terriglobales bacterium]